MIINAINSGANVFMADLEDSMSPTWDNIIASHKNLNLASRGKINYYDRKTKKSYFIKEEGPRALLFLRPRSLHKVESHILVDDQPISASLFDIGVFLWHNQKYLRKHQ